MNSIKICRSRNHCCLYAHFAFNAQFWPCQATCFALVSKTISICLQIVVSTGSFGLQGVFCTSMVTMLHQGAVLGSNLLPVELHFSHACWLIRDLLHGASSTTSIVVSIHVVQQCICRLHVLYVSQEVVLQVSSSEGAWLEPAFNTRQSPK